MPNFCSSCGTKIEDGMKFCQNCGAQIQTKETTSTFEEQVAQSQEQSIPIQISPPPIPKKQQQMGQTQAYSPMQPKKSNMKVIGVIIAFIAVLVVVLIIVFIFLEGTDGRFVGRWEQEGSSGYASVVWNFQSDGNLNIITETIYSGINTVTTSWNVKGNQICTPFCYNYHFSDNGNTLTLSDPSGLGVSIRLNKI